MPDPLQIDDLDRKILALLTRNGRATFEELGREIGLSAPATKRRVDRLRARGVIRGFTTQVDHRFAGQPIEAFIELFYAPGVGLDEVRRSLEPHPEIVEAWSITGDADCIARVRARDPADLERVIMELQHASLVVRTRSQVAMSQLLVRRD